MKDGRKHSGGETVGDVCMVCKRIKVQKLSFNSYNGEISCVWSTSHCIWMGVKKRFLYLLEALECALLLKKQRYGRTCLRLILIVLFSFGPSLLLKLCQSSCWPPYFSLVSPFLLYMLTFFSFPSLSSPVVLALANSEVLVYHFKCFKLPLGQSPPLVLGDLFWKPSSPLQHPTSEAKETGRFGTWWSALAEVCFGRGGGKDGIGGEVAENDKPVINLICENCKKKKKKYSEDE